MCSSAENLGHPCRMLKAWRKEYKRKYSATPHGKAKQKEYDAKRRANPQRKA